MTKKSFFERLTGAADEENSDPQPKKAEPAKSVKLEQKKKTKASKQTTKKQSTSKTKNASEQEQAQNWSPDEEGQLTIDIYQTENDIVIKSTIAGATSEDIDVSITNEMVTIKGIRKKDENIPPENYYYQELYWGPFSRSIILPVDIDSNKVKASMKDGILTIRLPKAEKLKTKTIKVKEIE